MDRKTIEMLLVLTEGTIRRACKEGWSQDRLDKAVREYVMYKDILEEMDNPIVDIDLSSGIIRI